MMNYETVFLEEKIVVGICAVTGNADPKVGEIIGGLWEQFYQGGVSSTITNRSNDRAIGLYSDYENELYCVTVGNEVTKPENSELTVKVIPAGKYAKFSVQGHMVTAVSEAWNEIWKLDLDRSYTGDFEEYLNSDYENAEIDIYIALK